jgi:colanic acid biosynthesis glycosyl transferase WcaI
MMDIMKKRILLIGYNYYPEPTGIGKYNGEMMRWFMGQGYDCTVVTSYPYYPFWKVQEPYFSKRFWYSTEKETDSVSQGKLKIIRCPQYVPSQPSGLKRILLDLSFLISSSLPLIRLMFASKFDVILTVAPSFQVGLLGVFFKKIRKAKLVYHIQDMQIEAARDLKMIKSPGLINTLFKIEKFIFNQSDIVSSISDGMVEKIAEKAQKDVLQFPNWTDTNIFYPLENRLEYRNELGYSPSDKIVLYSGSIGEKQGLDAILYAADALRQHGDIKFIICGSGPYKVELKKIAEKLKLDNLDFLPIQPFEKFNQFLNIADLHLIIQKASASDLVMPSKLTTMLSVGGLSLITANEGSGLYRVVKGHNIGILTEAENQTALNEGILKAIQGDFSHLNKNARNYAENYLAIDKIMGNFEKHILGSRHADLPVDKKAAPSTGQEPNNRVIGGPKSNIPAELINPTGESTPHKN